MIKYLAIFLAVSLFAGVASAVDSSLFAPSQKEAPVTSAIATPPAEVPSASAATSAAMAGAGTPPAATTVTSPPPTTMPEGESYAHSLCHAAGYHCIPVKYGDTWVKLWPDAFDREKIMRLNRCNMPLRVLDFVVVPDNLREIEYQNLSPFPLHIVPPKHKLIYVDLSKFAYGAYDPEGNLVRWGPASSGRSDCTDAEKPCETPTGTFRIYRVQGADCISSEFPHETGGGAPMPWCMHYFHGVAIHASTLSGFVNKSQGCVRVFDSDARWLNQEFVKVGVEVSVKP